MVEQLLQEWSTYTISDFLLFSPRAYYRMLALYNRAVWPAHIIGLAAGAGILLLLRRSTGHAARWILLILALAWSWVAWPFHLDRYSSINWAAPYLACAFALEALLLAIAAFAVSTELSWPRRPVQWISLTIFIFALAFYPLVAALAGREWSEAEVFGLAPDPTALGTLGLLLLGGRFSFFLMIIPFLWAVIASLTLYGMGVPDAWLLPSVAALALVAALCSPIRLGRTGQ